METQGKRNKTTYEVVFKRPIDFLISLLAILLLSPLMLALAVLIKLKIGSPVLFKQSRPGQNEKIFNMYKFRSMTNASDEKGNLLPDKDRLTKFGRFLRSTSLDELPGLFAILAGKMSLVGPRPLLVKYLPLYNEKQKKRHLVRPGLTGLAQVNGRNAISWERKFEYDIEYVKKITFFGDVLIILKTLIKVFKRADISSDTHETMEYFKGTDLP